MEYTYSEYMSSGFIEKYLIPYLTTELHNRRTAKEYVGYIRILCNHVRKDFLDITDLDAVNVMSAWQTKLKDGSLTRKTICVRLSCYNSLGRYISSIDPEYQCPFAGIGRPHVDDQISPSRIPSMREIDQLMSATAENEMYYLILALVTRACLSSTKITKLTINSIVREEDKLALLFQTGKVDIPYEVIVLPEDLKPIFEHYVSNLQNLDEQGHLFYNKWGNPLTIKNLDSAVAKIIRSSGIEHQYTIKDMRARGILELINAGADESAVMKYTGLGAMRTRQFAEAKGLISECPADLVNYRLKSENQSDSSN